MSSSNDFQRTPIKSYHSNSNISPSTSHSTTTPLFINNNPSQTRESQSHHHHHHHLEGDGILINLYHYLWKKPSSNNCNNSQSILNISIPPTIIYELNFPSGWFFNDHENHNHNLNMNMCKNDSDSDGELKKKTGKDLDSKNIVNEFLGIGKKKKKTSCSKKGENDNKGEIIGMYISKSSKVHKTRRTKMKMKMNIKNKNEISIEFFNEEMFKDFIWKRNKKPEGILQKFIKPKGNRNTTIQAIWTNYIFTIERRKNNQKLNSYSNTLYEKAVTYEGPSYYSEVIFIAPKLSGKVEEVCKNIVKHFYVTEGKRISRMVLYFKVDKRGKLYLLWGSSLRVEKEMVDYSPLNLAPVFVSPEARKREKREIEECNNEFNEIEKKESIIFECPDCEKIVNRKDQIFVESIVEYFKNFRDPLVKKIRSDSISQISEEEKNELLEAFDDMVYDVYSNFLVHKGTDNKWTFQLPVNIPHKMKLSFVSRLENIGVKKTDDGSNDNYIFDYNTTSVSKFQSEIDKIKRLIQEGRKSSLITTNPSIKMEIKRVFLSDNICKTEEVPKILKKSFKELNENNYRVFSMDVSFLNRRISLCVECCKKYKPNMNKKLDFGLTFDSRQENENQEEEKEKNEEISRI